MKKYYLGIAIVLTSLLTACTFGNEVETPNTPEISVTDTVNFNNVEVDPVKGEADNTVSEDEEKDSVDTGKETVDVEKDDKKDEKEETEPEEIVGTPMNEEREGYVSFVEYKKGLLDIIPEDLQEYYNGRERYYVAVVDLDKDNIDDKILIVKQNDPMFGDNICGDLFVIFDNGNTYYIGTEDYYEYCTEVQFYTGNDKRNFVVLNFLNSMTTMNGYVFSGKSNELIWDQNLPIGEKHISEFGYLVVTEETYTYCYDENGNWTGHVYVPHVLHLDDTYNHFVEYGIKEVTLAEVENCAKFDPKNMEKYGYEADKYYLRDDMTLIIVASKKDGSLTYYRTFFYWVGEADWVYQESVDGIYNPSDYGYN